MVPQQPHLLHLQAPRQPVDRSMSRMIFSRYLQPRRLEELAFWGVGVQVSVLSNRKLKPNLQA